MRGKCRHLVVNTLEDIFQVNFFIYSDFDGVNTIPGLCLFIINRYFSMWLWSFLLGQMQKMFGKGKKQACNPHWIDYTPHKDAGSPSGSIPRFSMDFHASAAAICIIKAHMPTVPNPRVVQSVP